MAKTHSDNAPTLLGFVAGLSIGYGIALLFAPDSGDETREKLKNSAIHQFDSLLARLEILLDQAYNKSLVDEAEGR